MATKRKKAVKSKKAPKPPHELDPGVIFKLNRPDAGRYSIKGIRPPITVTATDKGNGVVGITMTFDIKQSQFSKTGFSIPDSQWKPTFVHFAFDGTTDNIKLTEKLKLFVINPTSKKSSKLKVKNGNLAVESEYEIIAGKIGGGAG